MVELKEYLTDPSFVKFYKILKRDHPEADALGFFNSVMVDRQYFLANYEDYLKIEEYFLKSDLEENYKNLLFHAIYFTICNEFTESELKTGVLSESFKIILIPALKALPRLEIYHDVLMDISGFNFDEFKVHIDSLVNINQKKELINTKKAECREILITEPSFIGSVIEFIKKCDNELIIINQQLSSTNNITTPIKNLGSEDALNVRSHISALSINEQKNKVDEYLAFLKGCNYSGEKIMTDLEFDRLIKYTYHLVEFDCHPLNIDPLNKIELGSADIRYTFYLLHKELFSNKKIKDSWITFLHTVFKQFNGTEKATTKTKFSAKPKNYDSDRKAINSYR